MLGIIMKYVLLSISFLFSSFLVAMEMPPHKENADAEKNNDLLLRASVRGHGNVHELQQAIAHGADVNTYLHTTCQHGKPHNIALLLALGADPNTIDPDTLLTPLQRLCVSHDKKIINTAELLPCSFLLAAAGAEPEITCYDSTVFDWAMMRPFAISTKQLLQRVFDAYIPSESKSIEIVKDIYHFQIKELQECKNNINDPDIALRAFRINACLVGYYKKSPVDFITGQFCCDPIYLQHVPSPKIDISESLVGKNMTQKDLKQELRTHTHKLNLPNQHGTTLLMEAVQANDSQRVQTLINSGADIYAVDNEEQTALDIAAKKGSLETIRILLKEYDAHKKIQRHMPQIPAHLHPAIVNILQKPTEIAARNQHPGCSQLIFNYNKSTDPFFMALLMNDAKKLEEIFTEQPEKIKQPLILPRLPAVTPLEWAQLIEDKELITYLQKKGAQPVTKKFQDALSDSVRHNNFKILKSALRAGALINGYDSKGNTALLWACSVGKPEVISLLIRKGADLNIDDRDKHRCGLRWLLRMHDRSQKKNGRQFTTSEFLPRLFLLIDGGADTKIVDDHGENIHDWILKQGFSDDEFSLVTNIVFMHEKRPESQELFRELLLHAIYNFQNEELEKARAEKDLLKAKNIENALVGVEGYRGKVFFDKMYKKKPVQSGQGQ